MSESDKKAHQVEPEHLRARIIPDPKNVPPDNHKLAEQAKHHLRVQRLIEKFITKK